MVSLEQAINELNNGAVEFTYPKGSGCATEGEVVIYLKRLKSYEELGFEPEQIKEIIEQRKGMSRCELLAGEKPVPEDKPKTESEKFANASEDAAVCSEFLDFMCEKFAIFETKKDAEPVYYGVGTYINKEKLLAEYFGINLDKLEEERREALKRQV